jgi:hypothetical protein
MLSSLPDLQKERGFPITPLFSNEGGAGATSDTQCSGAVIDEQQYRLQHKCA